MFFNYTIGTKLNKNNPNTFRNKLLLIFGIVSNISLLGYFKYSDFFIENWNLFTDSNLNLLNLSLPLAISFFIFQQIAYLVDSYKQEISENKFLNYALFVTFFPQLIAGPIVHHKEMMPQFKETGKKKIDYRNISAGIFIFSIGLFKKVVIADTFSAWAASGFDTAITLNFFEAWATSLSYTFQLYFDFSGYTDMAIGLALLFNITLPINFNSPYKALNIQDFWRRWHITLSRFLRDYIYIPLGGNRKGNFKTYNNLMITFLIGGIWHGAGWTFLFWGFLHGMAMVIHKIWSKLNLFKLWNWIAWLITFNFINITWIFFRAKEWDDAIKVLKGMFGLTTFYLPKFLAGKFEFLNNKNIIFDNWLLYINGNYVTYIWIISSLIFVLYFKNSMEKLNKFRTTLFSLSLSIALFVISILYLTRISEFLYFDF